MMVTRAGMAFRGFSPRVAVTMIESSCGRPWSSGPIWARAAEGVRHKPSAAESRKRYKETPYATENHSQKPPYGVNPVVNNPDRKKVVEGKRVGVREKPGG